MDTVIGNKQNFAIELKILSFIPSLYGKTAIWINEEKIGVFDENEVLLGPFIRSLHRIIFHKGDFWDPELQGLDCKKIFLTITPFFENDDDFHNVSSDYIDKVIKNDKYLMFWGENFDKWILKVVIHDEICTFLWYSFYDNNGLRINENVNLIKCKKIYLSDVVDIYKQLKNIIPVEYWPNLLS